MMKDQFANYVVQKILDTCNDKQQEILLSRIAVHLQALKKYTYGKHIVARVEQLCGEGTRYFASYRFYNFNFCYHAGKFLSALATKFNCLTYAV